MLTEYMNTGEITIQDYEIDVTYDEFANPSFENELQYLAGALQSRSISPEMYIDKLYGTSLSDEQKKHELEFIQQRFELEDQMMAAEAAGAEDEML